jgi:hypothetical protein
MNNQPNDQKPQHDVIGDIASFFAAVVIIIIMCWLVDRR